MALGFKKISIIFVLAVFVVSCSDEYRNAKNIDILTSNDWIVNTYVDNSLNKTLDTQHIVYSFEKDGELRKKYESGFVAVSCWDLSGNNEYLRLGNNVFRLQTLTNRVMALRYGEVDMFFISL